MTKQKTKQMPGDGNKSVDFRESLQPYFDSYPKHNTLYVASDGTPFLEKQWAVEHQRTLDPTVEITIVNR